MTFLRKLITERSELANEDKTAAKKQKDNLGNVVNEVTGENIFECENMEHGHCHYSGHTGKGNLVKAVTQHEWRKKFLMKTMEMS